MKKIYLLITILFFANGYSQFNRNAPWLQNNVSTNKKEMTVSELTTAFDTYWKDKDYDKKGSGYKPFKRWENHWENLTNSNGNIMLPQNVWDALNQKKASKSITNKSLPVSNWQSLGPLTHLNTGSWSSGQGRVGYVEVDPSNANTIYVGTPAGGIWKSINNGATWLPLSDNLPQIGVSGIAVDHSNSNIIYIATGDKDSSDTYSIGVLKSTNGGTTWNTTGLTFNNTTTLAGDIIMHPTNNQILWCATNIGIYKTSNAGLSWTLTQAGNFSSGTIRYKPGTPSTVYAVSNNKFYLSTNSGDTFTASTSTILPATAGRLILDVTAANSGYVYILAASTGGAFLGIYRSTNSGVTWTKTSTTATPAIFDGSTQAYYDLALAASQTDANEIYTGTLNIWKSTNGGTGFTKLNNWNAPTSPSYTHADIHFLRFYGNKLFAGTDGGIYVSADGGTNFTDLTAGLQISQFYKVAVSKQSAGKITGGLQDNGGYALSNGQWKNFYGADGMDSAIDPNNNNKYYGFIQRGNSLYISNDSGNSLGSSVGSPGGVNGNWVTPLVINSTGEVFSGFSGLYKLNGATWTLQNTTPLGTGNIELISIDPSNDNNMYVANGSSLFKSTDKGINFTEVYIASFNITSICVNYSNSNIIYLTTATVDGEALKSIDGGLSFTSFSENLPNIGKKVIKHQGRNTLNPLYLGTTLGVYYRDDSMTQWEPFDNNLPNVEVTDLEVNLEDNILVAATYGRGVWSTVIPNEVPLNDLKLLGIQNPSININCNGTITPQIAVKNNGTNPISIVNISYNYNGTPLSYVWNGTIVAGANQIITLPSFTATKGIYNLNVNSTIVNDAYSDNNIASVPFYINDTGTLNVVNTFENATTSLLTYNDGTTSSQWQRGTRVGSALATGANNVYTTNFTGNYPDGIKSYLYSQCYNLANVVNPQIKFKMAFDLEQDYDIVYVEYSTNMGQTWSTLGNLGANWYNSDLLPGATCDNCSGAQWTGTNTTFTDYFYPLNSLVGQANVIFRIVFQSDSNTNNLGVIIDNFVIEGTLGTEEFELKNVMIYPNPSNGIFTISAGDKEIENIEVYDVSGKKIVSIANFSASNTTSTLDLSTIANGVYFVKISAENQKTVKRIIKN